MVQLLEEQIELAKMWMKLDEKDRMKFKRELFAKALQHADDVRDENVEQLSAADKIEALQAAGVTTDAPKRKPGKSTN